LAQGIVHTSLHQKYALASPLADQPTPAMSRYPGAAESLQYTMQQPIVNAAARSMVDQEPPLSADGYYKGGTMTTLDRLATPKNVFVVTGCFLLAMLCTVPVWNAVALMESSNYVFWHGKTVPGWILICCLGVIVLYAITVATFFQYARPQVQTEQTIMMIANIFITLLGLMLMLLSLPLSRQSIDTYNNLMQNCELSEQTHRMYEYSQVLQNIRSTPKCAAEFSVETCDGYESAPPYTDFLKAMESDFRCSGFCFNQKVASLAGTESATPTDANATVSGAASLLHRAGGRAVRRHREVSVTPLALLSTDRETLAPAAAQSSIVAQPTSSYPPTLFSDANFQASCEGMAARDMKNFAGDIGYQTFYQGIYLVLIAVATGFLKLIGLCVRRDREADLKAMRY